MGSVPTNFFRRISRAEVQIKDIGRRFANAVDCFGLDQKLVYLQEQEGTKITLVKTYYRPLQEPALISYWDKIRNFEFDSSSAIELASLLTGERQYLRSKPMVGSAPDGTNFVFALHPNSQWIDMIHAAAEKYDNPIELAAKSFEIVIFQHPFTDGNGRFSRAMIYAALARFNWITTPCLGLNGVFEAHRQAMAEALQKSCHTKSSDALMRGILTLIEDSIRLMKILESKL